MARSGIWSVKVFLQEATIKSDNGECVKGQYSKGADKQNRSDGYGRPELSIRNHPSATFLMGSPGWAKKRKKRRCRRLQGAGQGGGGKGEVKS